MISFFSQPAGVADATAAAAGSAIGFAPDAQMLTIPPESGS
jgi:hypothetical protein